MDFNYLIGRILFSVIFVMSGVMHFVKADSMADLAATKGAPAPKLAVLGSGVALLAGGLSVMLGLWMEIGTWLLVFFLILAAVVMHDFWAIDDPAEAQTQQAHFMKNVALAGAALVLYWLVQAHGPGPFTLGTGIE